MQFRKAFVGNNKGAKNFQKMTKKERRQVYYKRLETEAKKLNQIS